uniref:Alpha-2-macroglobulin domain-containing protein n=1 Tax=Pygocentrus nattereri TaxID=42514 RepID=A0A3B4EDW2_PYGNA
GVSNWGPSMPKLLLNFISFNCQLLLFAFRYFMVMFPAVIESGSEATLCASLMRPNETLQMTVYLVHFHQNKTLLQETVKEDFHRCSQFKVVGDSMQYIRVHVKGERFQMTEKRKVMLKSYKPLTFIQTDKPIYNPGQTGTPSFRISTRFNLHLLDEDNKGNRIGQWTNVSSQSLIVQLSHKLNPEAPEGQYKLKVRSVTHHFKVKKNVLPRFEITVKVPQKQSLHDEEMKIEVCAKYTYGLPVPGKALVQVCWASYFRRFTSLCMYFYLFCFSVFFNSQFDKKCCFPPDQQIKVTKFTGKPIPNKNVYLMKGDAWSPKLLQNLTTDINGLARFSVNSLCSLLYPPSKLKEFDMPFSKISFAFFERHRPAEPYNKNTAGCIFNMMFFGSLVQVMSKGAIVHHGYEKVEVKESKKLIEGKVSFRLSVDARLAPVVQVLVYCVLPSEKIITATKKFNVEKCFRNKVSLQFSPTEAVPGEENTLQLSAQPGSLCGLSAVDQSVFSMEQGKRLNADEVMFSTNAESGPVSPETWIWQLAEVGDSGSAQVPVTVHDTMTTWEADAFCLSSKGLGLAPPVQLRVSQPFFLELSLPYSIIRGEEFELKATVFNYLSKCIMVKVTPAPSSLYTLKASSDGEYSSCLCASSKKIFKWTLVPSVLGVLNVTVSAEAEQSQTVCDNEIVSVPERGRIDTVTRSLLVQGEHQTVLHSKLPVSLTGNSVSEEMELVLPEDVIEGSARASVSVLGDILGRALKNIDGLLKMPHGCQEQNIALLAPNIYILQYLENTGQLTAAIRERATGFLKSEYQRQLNYKHVDGAYSTFGSGEGNTWLTAFVLKTFGKAQHYIFIDPQNIDRAKKWLISNQRPDGCFIRRGQMLKYTNGGINDDMTITAYITASFLELGEEVQDPVVSKGLSCLKSSIGNLTNTYATALLAYTFSLAGEHDAWEQLLKKLDSVAISGDGRLHWSQSASDDSDSLSVEISSYVLLAVLTTSEVTAADLGYANRIVSWLVRQQNPYGGYASIQDTVVALQALALYSTKVFSSDGSSTVTVQSDKESHDFDVNQSNKLLYQERPLQVVPGKYSISVKGSTCVSVQVSVSSMQYEFYGKEEVLEFTF